MWSGADCSMKSVLAVAQRVHARLQQSLAQDHGQLNEAPPTHAATSIRMPLSTHINAHKRAHAHSVRVPSSTALGCCSGTHCPW